MTLHQLRVFVSVAKHLSVTKAAEELHASQSSISQRLRSLADEYGPSLFKRTGHGLALTERGRALLPEAQALLTHVTDVERKLRNGMNGEVSQTLAVGASHSQSISVLPAALKCLRKKYSGLSVTIRTKSSRKLEQLLLQSQIEVALITQAAAHPLLSYEVYREERLAVFTSPKHRLLKTRRIDFADLAHQRFVNLREGQSEKVLKEFTEHGLRPKIVTQCDSAEAVIATVKKEGSIGILFRVVIEPHLRTCSLRLIEIPGLKLRTHSFIVSHRERSLSPIARELIALLQAQNSRVLYAREQQGGCSP